MTVPSQKKYIYKTWHLRRSLYLTNIIVTQRRFLDEEDSNTIVRVGYWGEEFIGPLIARYKPTTQPGHYFLTRGGSLGVGIPGAIGAKIANPNKTVIGFTGDGGAMYTIQALWTAARHNVDAKFVVCNNRSYRILQLNIQAYWKEQGIPEPQNHTCN